MPIVVDLGVFSKLAAYFFREEAPANELKISDAVAALQANFTGLGQNIMEAMEFMDATHASDRQKLKVCSEILVKNDEMNRELASIDEDEGNGDDSRVRKIREIVSEIQTLIDELEKLIDEDFEDEDEDDDSEDE